MKIYLGDGKGPKNFAKEYLERRSKYKNSLKCASQNLEDDLLTPAHAINPNREAENDGMGGGIGKTQYYFPKKEVWLRIRIWNIHFGNLLILIVNMRLML